MSKILVCGLINIETTLQVEGFPIEYSPVRYPFHGIRSTVAGVGFNIAKALTTLGDDVTLISLVGRDLAGKMVIEELARQGMSAEFVLPASAHTAQSVILFDGQGRRQINTDLKDIQEQTYPDDRFQAALAGCDLAVLANINFSRPFLEATRRAGKLIATDVHTISDLDDEYNAGFMRCAHILFMSDERLPCPPGRVGAAGGEQVWNGNLSGRDGCKGGVALGQERWPYRAGTGRAGARSGEHRRCR
jgi:ribokinase